MKTTYHGDHLIKLTRFWSMNCYLVREADGLTLIDTGISGSASAILAAAEREQLPITRLALTHAHVDHVGSLDAISAQLPAVEIAFSERTACFLAGEVSLRPDEPQTKIKGGFTPCTTQATRLLQPGDRFGSLTVIAVPGHSPDQIAFWDERDGSLIAGDAFQTLGGIAVSGALRWRFPFPAMATWHRPTALATARTLRQLNPTRLAVGHGPVIEQPGPIMDAAIAETERQLGLEPTHQEA